MTKSFSMRWVIALKAEAKEIIKQYDLISLIQVFFCEAVSGDRWIVAQTISPKRLFVSLWTRTS